MLKVLMCVSEQPCMEHLVHVMEHSIQRSGQALKYKFWKDM